MDSLSDLVNRAQEGDLEAYGRLVQATQARVCYGIDDIRKIERANVA